MNAPDLSIIIVSWNTRELLRDCVSSIQEHLGGVPHEVIVVDNASSDDSVEMINSEFPDVRVINNHENVGFGVANNQGMRAAAGEWVLLLNSDTQLVDDSVARLFRKVAGENQVGVAQCRLFFPDGRLQHSTHRFPSLGLTLFEGIGVYKLFP